MDGWMDGWLDIQYLFCICYLKIRSKEEIRNLQQSPMYFYKALLILIAIMWKQVTLNPSLQVIRMEQNVLLCFLYLNSPRQRATVVNRTIFSLSLKKESMIWETIHVSESKYSL
jgi:hypothetical protein